MSVLSICILQHLFMPQSISTHFLKDILTAHLGGQASDWQITPIKTGKFNQSFWANNKQDKVVIRVAPADETGFLFYERRMMRQEPDLHTLIRQKTNIPVPEIMVHDFSHQLIDRDFVIMEALPGEPLSDIVTLSHDERTNVLKQVGVYLRQLHTITGSLYGYNGPHEPNASPGNLGAGF